MHDALAAFLTLPALYLAFILKPFYAGPVTALPALTVVALTVGSVLGVLGRHRDLLFFLLLPVSSQGLLVLVALWHDTLSFEAIALYLVAFFILQVAAAGYLVFRSSEARLAASLLAIFTVPYALCSVLLAGLFLLGTTD